MVLIKIILLFSILNCYSCQEQVKVSLYYESHCPYCQNFVTEELYPSYLKIGEYLNVDLVPFGNAKQSNKNGKWQFTCQHGVKECRGNKIQACALWQNSTQSRSVEFVNCMMQSDAPESYSITKQCASKSKISWSKIKSCLDNQADEVLAHFGTITNSLDPVLDYVPYLRFNDVYNQTVDEMATDHFLKTVCSMFREPPSGCKKSKVKHED